MDAVDLVFRYRMVLAKIHSGSGLDWDDIALVSSIEGQFASSAQDLRSFGRQPQNLAATLRTDGTRETVRVVELSPGGLVCQLAPLCQVGDAIEIIIDAHTDLATSADEPLQETRARSYRFAGIVTWVRNTDDDLCTLGLKFVGVPVVVHYVVGARLSLPDARRAA